MCVYEGESTVELGRWRLLRERPGGGCRITIHDYHNNNNNEQPNNIKLVESVIYVIHQNQALYIEFWYHMHTK
jgi:hypothetical protein